MQLSFTQKKNVRKSFGKLAETLSIPNLIEVQKNSYKELTDFDSNLGDLSKGFDRVFKSIFPIEDLNEKEHWSMFLIDLKNQNLIQKSVSKEGYLLHQH